MPISQRNLEYFVWRVGVKNLGLEGRLINSSKVPKRRRREEAGHISVTFRIVKHLRSTSPRSAQSSETLKKLSKITKTDLRLRSKHFH